MFTSALSSKKRAIRTLTNRDQLRGSSLDSQRCRAYRIIRELVFLTQSIMLTYIFWEPTMSIVVKNRKKNITTNQSIWVMVKCFCDHQPFPKAISGMSSKSFQKYIICNYYDKVLETMIISDLILHLYDILPLANSLSEVGIPEFFFKNDNLQIWSEITYVCGCKECISSFQSLCQRTIKKKKCNIKDLKVYLSWFPNLNHLDSNLTKSKYAIENIISLNHSTPLTTSDNNGCVFLCIYMSIYNVM